MNSLNAYFPLVIFVRCLVKQQGTHAHLLLSDGALAVLLLLTKYWYEQ